MPTPVGPGPEYGLDAAAIMPDGGRIVTSYRRIDRTVLGTGRIEVTDVTTGAEVRSWTLDADRLAVSPDGRLVAEATPSGDVAVHDVASGREVQRLVGHVGQVWDLHISPDGRLLASTGQDATVRLWDLRSGTQRLVLRGHESVALTGRFSPDGRRLVTTSGDRTARVWALDLDDLVRIAEDGLTRSLTDDECRRYLQRACS